MEKMAIYGFIVLIAIIGVESFAFLSTYSSLNALQTQYNTLSTEHAELTGEYNDLQTDTVNCRQPIPTCSLHTTAFIPATTRCRRGTRIWTTTTTIWKMSITAMSPDTKT